MTSAIAVNTPKGTLACRDTRIVGAPADDAVVLTGAAFRPGHVCAHTHLYSGLAPLGMPAPVPAPENFVQILQRVWWRLDRALDRDTLRAAARLYVAEALLAGTTTLVDHHESPNFIESSLDVLAYACELLGARALLCYGATERNDGHDEARRGLDECVRLITERESDTVRGMIALHASFTVSDDTIRRAGDLARQHGTVVHVHLAEDGADVTDAIERGFAGPLKRLMALDALPKGSILAHGVHLTEAQVEVASRHGCWFVHNPRSNAGNQVGYASVLCASDRVALGTDGYPARMADELSAVGEGIAVGQARLDAGRRLAAERFGVDFDLEPGGAADFVVLNEAGQARHVVVNGRLVVEDGRLTHGDIDLIRAQAREAATRLWTRMEEF
jgi:cytosine/adenosine deaminase-related metal-dependent hydrolase